MQFSPTKKRISKLPLCTKHQKHGTGIGNLSTKIGRQSSCARLENTCSDTMKNNPKKGTHMDNTQAIKWAKFAQENHNTEDLNIRDIVDFLLADDNDREKLKDNTLISVESILRANDYYQDDVQSAARFIKSLN